MSTRRPADFRSRRVVVGNNGMAATSHPQSSLAAINILQAGGNAVDAAIAAVAVQSVVEPLSTGLGGDCFAIYCPSGHEPIALNGSGRSPADTRLSTVRESLKSQHIPAFSAHAVTVPGAVDAWCRLLTDHGTMTLSDVLAPAIACAENGFCVAPRVAAVRYLRARKRNSASQSRVGLQPFRRTSECPGTKQTTDAHPDSWNANEETV